MNSLLFKHTTFQHLIYVHHKDCLNALKKLDRTLVAGRDITPNVTSTVLFIILTIILTLLTLHTPILLFLILRNIYNICIHI